MNKIVISGIFIIGISIPFVIGSSGEHYNTWSGKITCSENCWHEIGHKIDHQSGWISKSPEYREAIAGIIDLDKPLSLVYLFNREFGLYTELYAEMLNLVDGDISKLPVGLQRFYDLELANDTITQLIP